MKSYLSRKERIEFNISPYKNQLITRIVDLYLSILDNNFLDHNSRWAEFNIFYRNYCFSFIIQTNDNFIFGCFDKYSNTFDIVNGPHIANPQYLYLNSHIKYFAYNTFDFKTSECVQIRRFFWDYCFSGKYTQAILKYITETDKKRKYIKKILKTLAKSLIEIQHIISLETFYSKLYIIITKQMLNQI